MFDYEILLDGVRDSPDEAGHLVLVGRLRGFADVPIALGGTELGALNLGFRLHDEADGRFLIENRAALGAAELPPLAWIGFGVEIPPLAVGVSRLQVTLDLVFEQDYWFHVRGLPLFETVLDLASRSLTERRFTTRHANAGGAFAPDPDAEMRRAAERAEQDALAAQKLRPGIARHVLDVSDLIQYWQHSIRPTGIQRVQIEVVRQVFSGRPLAGVTGQVIVVFFDPDAGWWQVLEPDRLLRQVGLSFQVSLAPTLWHRELMRCLLLARQYLPQLGDMLVNLGTSWWLPDYHYRVRQLRLAFRAGYVPFIHDVIPLVVPQLCDVGLTEEFRLWFREAIAVADHVVVNSSFSRRDIIQAAEQLGGRELDPTVVRLNALYPPPSAEVPSAIVERHDLDIGRYVLCVGTLEGRKNHSLLFQVWLRLAERLPAERQARLVLVGKRGSLFEEAGALLERSAALREQLLILTEVSDLELADLYRAAAFTVYPSFYEGWGLPVTEATGHGKLTVASTASSLPEVVSPGDILLDPNDVDGWTETIARLLLSDEALAAATANSRAQANLRSWHDIAADIFADVEAHAGGLLDAVRPSLVDGRIYDFSAVTARRRHEHSALSLRRGNGWQAPEPWGTWSADGLTELAFAVATAAPHYAYLRLRASPETLSVIVTADRSTRIVQALRPHEDAVLRLEIGSDIEHTLRLTVTPLTDCAVASDGRDRRLIGVGVLQLMVTTQDDVNARLAFIEATQMQVVEAEQGFDTASDPLGSRGAL